MYSEKIIKHFVTPKNVGKIVNADGVGVFKNEKCAIYLRVYLKVEDETIVDAKFKVMGSAVAIASSDIAMEMIKGKSISQAKTYTNEDFSASLNDLTPEKKACSVVAEQAIKNAIENYKSKVFSKAIKHVQQ